MDSIKPLSLWMLAALLLGCQPFYRDDELRALRAADPRPFDQRLTRAQKELGAGQPARAARLMSAALERSPDRDTASFLLLAQAQQSSGQHAKARATARFALQRPEGRAGEHDEVRRFLMMSYAEDQLIGRALDWLEPQRVTAAAEVPALAKDLAALATAEQLAGTQPAQALSSYAQWLSAYGEPDHPLLRSARARILSAVAPLTADFAEEGRRLLRAGDASGALRQYALVYRYYSDEAFASSEPDFLRACAAITDPESTSPFASSEARRGDLELGREHLGAAIKSYRLAVAAAPCWPAAHRKLALLLAQAELFAEAVRQMDWFLKLSAAPPPQERGLRDDWATPPATRLAAESAIAADDTRFTQHAAVRRNAGIALFAIAGLSGGLAGLFGYLGADVNHQIQSSSQATLDQLNALHASGQRDNYAAIGCAVGAGLLVAVGLPIFGLGLRKPKPRPLLSPLSLIPNPRSAP